MQLASRQAQKARLTSLPVLTYNYHFFMYVRCISRNRNRFDSRGRGLGVAGRRDIRDLPKLWAAPSTDGLLMTCPSAISVGREGATSPLAPLRNLTEESIFWNNLQQLLIWLFIIVYFLFCIFSVQIRKSGFSLPSTLIRLQFCMCSIKLWLLLA